VSNWPSTPPSKSIRKSPWRPVRPKSRRPPQTVSDAEIDKTVDILRKQRVHFHVKGEQGAHGDGGADVSAQNGDRVTDFVGKIDGVEFAGGKAEDFPFVLGEGRMLPEFETATSA
jgi:trigger factor